MSNLPAAVQVLNFYSTIFADQLKRGRKTATIRLGDKSHKYRKNQAVLVTVGYQHSPREKIFEAVIDQVEVKRFKDLSPRDIEHDNPEFRRHDEMQSFLEQIYGKTVAVDDIVTVVRFSQIVENPPGMTDRHPRLRRRAELAIARDGRQPPAPTLAIVWHSRDESAKDFTCEHSDVPYSGAEQRVGTLPHRVPTPQQPFSGGHRTWH